MTEDKTDPPEPTNAPSTAETQTRASAALVLVSTPLGNLKDFSARAVETLAGVDAILCEDTRTSAVLLRAHGLRTRLVALHEHNEDSRIPGLVAAMLGGACYALISDAGTPLVSDPGYRLVRAAIAAGLRLSGVPGPNAAVLALVLSGLPPLPFMVLGFLAPKAGPRRAAFARLRALEAAGLRASLVFYEAPHRLAAFCADAAEVFGERPAAVCRELTKFYEEVRRGSLGELAAHYAEHAARGEITVVIGPAEDAAASAEGLEAALVSALGRMSLKDAVGAVSEATGMARKLVYSVALEINQKLVK